VPVIPPARAFVRQSPEKQGEAIPVSPVCTLTPFHSSGRLGDLVRDKDGGRGEVCSSLRRNDQVERSSYNRTC
jgi:hypothetical protein